MRYLTTFVSNSSLKRAYSLNGSMPVFKIFGLVALILLGVASGSTRAAPEEIQVYMDEMNAPGEIGLDLHNNYVVSGSSSPDYSGALPPRHVYRLTPEFSVGLTPNFELGAYVLSTVDSSGNSNVDGEKLRLKYIATKGRDQAYFVGANLEIGRVARLLDENPWNGELKGILGYRTDRWTFAANGNIDWKISGPASAPTSFELDSKVSYETHDGYSVGLESYNELGEIRHMGQLNQQSQTLYGVIDTSIGGWNLNLGIGRGLSSVSDHWVVKAIVSVPIGK